MLLVTVILVCDTCGHVLSLEAPEDQAQPFRASLKLGWTHPFEKGEQKNYCPECSEHQIIKINE